MTVSFGFIFAVSAQEIAATPAGYPFEWLVRSLLGHLYVLAMAYSSLQALRCVNEYTQKMLGLVQTPSKLVPHFERMCDDVNAIASAGPNGEGSDPVWTTMLRSDKEWDKIKAKIHQRSWSHRLLRRLKVQHGNYAFFSAVDSLNAGIAIGAFLKFGAGYAIMLGVLFYITATEVKHIKDTEYKLPWEAMWRTLPRERIEQPRPAATAPTAPAAAFRGQTLSRTQSAPGA